MGWEVGEEEFKVGKWRDTLKGGGDCRSGGEEFIAVADLSQAFIG